MLQEALTLLAYRKPSASPAAHLLDQSHRQQCADAVNGMLLQMQGHDAQHNVDNLQRQLLAVTQHLQSCDSLDAHVFKHMVEKCADADRTRSDVAQTTEQECEGHAPMHTEIAGAPSTPA